MTYFLNLLKTQKIIYLLLNTCNYRKYHEHTDKKIKRTLTGTLTTYITSFHNETIWSRGTWHFRVQDSPVYTILISTYITNHFHDNLKSLYHYFKNLNRKFSIDTKTLMTLLETRRCRGTEAPKNAEDATGRSYQSFYFSRVEQFI